MGDGAGLKLRAGFNGERTGTEGAREKRGATDNGRGANHEAADPEIDAAGKGALRRAEGEHAGPELDQGAVEEVRRNQ